MLLSNQRDKIHLKNEVAQNTKICCEIKTYVLVKTALTSQTKRP